MTIAAHVDADELRAFAEAVFRAANFRAAHARHGADALLWASLRGVDTHGIRNLKRYYIDSIGGVGRRDGVILADAEWTVDRESESTAAWNAHGGLGLAVAAEAMDRAIEKAERHGVGIVVVRNSTHFGAAGCYADRAASRGLLGLAATGYFFPHGQDKAVVPFGGLLPMLSTNPLAVACPADQEPTFLLDMSTSVVPVNRIEMLEELGRRIPPGWALDENHQPTDSPAAVRKVVPLGGASQHGGHKGYGLALAAWLATGLLSGAWRPDPRPDRVLGDRPDTRHGFAQEGIGHCLAAIRLDDFGDPRQIRRGLDAMIRSLNDSPPAPGFDQVLVPGQIEHRTMQQRLRQGIPLSPATLEELQSLAKEYSVPLRLRSR